MLLNKKQMRAVGCLLGGAVGDALGYAVEFYSADKIFALFGERGITDYQLINGVAEISDDTQMTLFTAEAMLNKQQKESFADSLYSAYLRWLKTQNEPFDGKAGGLLSIQTLYSRRAPGNTCINALESGTCGSVDDPINRSKGCGGIMRVAPIALYCHSRAISIRDADLIAADAAAVTHGHELGFIPAALFVHILYLILDGVGIEEAVTETIKYAPSLFPGSLYVGDAISPLKNALELARVAKSEDIDDLDAIRELGEGWVAEETLAIAVYCASRHSSDFSKAVIAAANHDGDSDSTAAVTGNIVGASLGAATIPRKYLDTLELRKTILDIALRLSTP